MKNKLHINFILNNLNLILKLLFPLITFPYVARVLEPETKGLVDFSISIVSYFIILSTLGIPIYGIREIAKNRDDKFELSKVVLELLIISFFSIIVFLGIYFILIFKSEKIYSNRLLFFILSLNIIFTPMGIEWFYQGMEEYKYITIRNFIFQIISLVMIFVFVKTKQDYLKYSMIVVFQTVGSNILNIFNLRKYIEVKKDILKKLNFKKHMKPLLVTLGMRLASTIYVNLDSTMLGYLSTNKSVGYYSSAVKFNKIAVAVGTSLSSVMIPRISMFIKNNELEKVKLLNKQAISFIMFFSLPVTLFLLVLAPNVILVLLGKEYYNSILTMRIMTPIIFFMSFSSFTGVQILYANGEDKKMMYSLMSGAILNFIFNLVLIPKFSENGAAIGTLFAEGGVLSVQLIFAKKYLNSKIFNKNNLKYIISAIISSLVILFLGKIVHEKTFINLIVLGITAIISYISILIFIKEEYTIIYYKKIKNKF